MREAELQKKIVDRLNRHGWSCIKLIQTNMNGIKRWGTDHSEQLRHSFGITTKDLKDTYKAMFKKTYCPVDKWKAVV